MGNNSSVAARLHIRDNSIIKESGSLSEAVLWCYGHDFRVPGAWPEHSRNRNADLRLKIITPHLDDYVRLILKDHADVERDPSLRLLSARLMSEIDALDHDEDGDLALNASYGIAARFKTVDEHPRQRDMEISIYPFAAFEFDFDSLLTRVPHGRDERSIYLADLFKFYFPAFSNGVSNRTAQSLEDKAYKLNVGALTWAMHAFVFGNPNIPDNRFRWREPLHNWVVSAVRLLSPRLSNEGL